MPVLPEALTPKKIGAYTLGRKLGAGGMATVFAARQDSGAVKRLVALKVLAGDVGKGTEEHKAFMREAMVAARLEHPNIVRTYDVGEASGLLYLAMELVHGASLAVCQRGLRVPPPLSIVMRIVSDVARALHAAHELSDPERGHLGLVHQDVSPQNILISYEGTIKLVDFGVARLATIEGSRTESLKGKPSYASPEQIHGRNIDRRTDVFALGVVLWELLSNERLFKRETSAATYLAVLQDPIPDIRTKNSGVSDRLANVLEIALAREREHRFETTEAMRRALDAARREASIPEATDEDLAGWVNHLAPAVVKPSELEREIVMNTSGSMPSLRAVPAPPTIVDASSVPDLDLAPPPSRRPSAPEAPTVRPPSRAGSPSASLPVAPLVVEPPRADAKAVSLDAPDDLDDFDMHIERNLDAQSISPAVGRPSMADAPRPRPSGTHGVASTGLELAARPMYARSRAPTEDYEPTIGMTILGWGVCYVVLGGTAAALVRFAHRAGGLSPTKLLPHAFDGSSVAASGAVSAVTLVAAIAVGYLGVRLKPRSWALVACAGALLLLALAMVTVTLASSGESPSPPDGVRLLPYLVPAVLVALGLGVAGRAANLFRREGLVRKLGAIPIAAIAGAFLFVAYETSHLVLP